MLYRPRKLLNFLGKAWFDVGALPDGQIERTSYPLERNNVAALAAKVKDFLRARESLDLAVGYWVSVGF
jgi:hypothetical protein